jgi:hypothetical protein
MLEFTSSLGGYKMTIRTYLKAVVFSMLFFLAISNSPAGAVNRIMPLGNSIANGNASGVVRDNSSYWISYHKDLWDQLVAKGYSILDVIDEFNPDV